MKDTALVIAAGLLLGLAAQARAEESHFVPKHLAVLRAGDGTFKLIHKQSPVFVDQFEMEQMNAAPSFTVAIPTNGPNSFFLNGHAASEGNLTRSADHKLLTFAGYGGMDLLKVDGTASRLNIPRGFATIDPSGAIHTYLYKADLSEDVKVNPRGVVTDGKNNFWGCGNANGTFFYNPTGSEQLVRFQAFPSSRDIDIINDTVYVTLNSSDAELKDIAAGIYSFEPDAMPRRPDEAAKLIVEAAPDYKKVVGFDINPAQNVAYMSDTAAGIQKYVKTNDHWTLAYNFSIPQTISKDENNSAGCFGLVVDFSQTAPVIYATTTEGYGGSVNSNRVVRIVDTNSAAYVATIAQAAGTNIAFRGITFTPD